MKTHFEEHKKFKNHNFKQTVTDAHDIKSKNLKSFESAISAKTLIHSRNI